VEVAIAIGVLIAVAIAVMHGRRHDRLGALGRRAAHDQRAPDATIEEVGAGPPRSAVDRRRLPDGGGDWQTTESGD
jgi:hypothetical protein